MAEHKMMARETTTKTTQMDLIHRDFEVKDIAQRCTAIQELNITRWCYRVEAIWHCSWAWFMKGIAKKLSTDNRDLGRERTKERDEVRGRGCSQLAST